MNVDIQVEKYPQNGYMKVWCKQGHYITNWNKENILDYNFSKEMYCKLNTNLDSFYCITDEEHKYYSELYDRAIKQREKDIEFEKRKLKAK